MRRIVLASTVALGLLAFGCHDGRGSPRRGSSAPPLSMTARGAATSAVDASSVQGRGLPAGGVVAAVAPVGRDADDEVAPDESPGAAGLEDAARLGEEDLEAPATAGDADDSGAGGADDSGAGGADDSGAGDADDSGAGGADAAEDDDELSGPADAAETAVETATTDPAMLFSTSRETWVLEAPRWSSRKLGYLRAGAAVRRGERFVRRGNCRGGWYPVEPRGYVCAGAAATTDPKSAVVALSARPPALDGLPYLYGLSRYPVPPLYARLPTVKEQRRTEPGLEGHLRKVAALAVDPSFVEPPPPEPMPELVAAGGVLPSVAGSARSDGQLLAGAAKVRSGFGMLATYEYEGRRFGLTTELALLPLDRVRLVAPSSFHGVVLSDELSLPLAFVKNHHAQRYRQEAGSRFVPVEVMAHRAAAGLTGRAQRAAGSQFLELLDGSWLRAADVVRVDRFTRAPRWSKPGVKWIDVSLLQQRLVAYEGKRPVYATLVSTGAGGIGDPEETHATVQGAFLIHTKHVSVTMDGDEAGDEFDLRDVPFVQYFTKGYALHAAYWHDDFGRARSHGCINLAPVDAAWLFGWTTPGVPEGWHAAMTLRGGTIVYVHP